MVGFADGLVWCTSAMQAWRQSEKSACNDFPEDLLDHATLLITQADRLPDDRQRGKVFKRVKRECVGLFTDLQMASLIDHDDVAMLMDHIKERASEMSLRGADAPEVDAHRSVAEAAVIHAEPDLADMAEPFDSADLNNAALVPDDADSPAEPTVRKFSAIWDAQPEEDGSDDGIKAPFANETGEVVQLSEHQKLLAENFAETDQGDSQTELGPAHRLWSKITEGADLDDIEQLKVCVKAMLEHLDSLSKASTDMLADEQQTKTQGA